MKVCRWAWTCTDVLEKFLFWVKKKNKEKKWNPTTVVCSYIESYTPPYWSFYSRSDVCFNDGSLFVSSSALQLLCFSALYDKYFWNNWLCSMQCFNWDACCTWVPLQKMLIWLEVCRKQTDCGEITVTATSAARPQLSCLYSSYRTAPCTPM